jgi:hypothetical protein
MENEMYRSQMRAILLGFAFLTATTVLAQSKEPPLKNEIGLVIGATEVPSIGRAAGGTIDLNSSLALGVEYDRRLLGKNTSLYVGGDFLASPEDVKVSNPASDVSPEYAYLFLSSHIKLKFNSTRTFQPWLSFGGGYADFAPAAPASGVIVKGKGNSGTLEFGGGLDTRPLITFKGIPLLGNLPIGARVEVRDFYSGQPQYGVATSGNLQNNVAFTGGFLLRF